MKRVALMIGCAVLGIGVLPGCSGGGDDGPLRVPAAVTVTHNGSPVEGANVTFVPKGEGQAAYGVTDGSGKAALSTKGEDDGAMPGDYQVLVRKTETTGPDIKIDSTEVGAMPDSKDAMKSAETRNLLPEKYAAIGTTDLEATVSEGAENQFTFDLTD